MENLSELKQYAQSHSVPIMQDAGIEFICQYIKDHPVKQVLEIGTAIGYSAMRFAQLREDLFVTTVEIDIDRYHQAVRNINEHNLLERITVYLGDALSYDFKQDFDLIFIDAAKSQYVNYFEKFKNNLAPGGVIITDNLFFHGMVEDLSLTHNYSTKKLIRKLRKYIDFLKFNNEFHTDFYELGDGLSVSRVRKSCSLVKLRAFSLDNGPEKGIQAGVSVGQKLSSQERELVLMEAGVSECIFAEKSSGGWVLQAASLDKQNASIPAVFAAAWYLFNYEPLLKKEQTLLLEYNGLTFSFTCKNGLVEMKLTEVQYNELMEQLQDLKIQTRTEGKRFFVSSRCSVTSSVNVYLE